MCSEPVMRAPFSGCAVGVLGADRHQARHLVLGEPDLLAAELGEREVGDLEVGRGGAGRCRHAVSVRSSVRGRRQRRAGACASPARSAASRRRAGRRRDGSGSASSHAPDRAGAGRRRVRRRRAKPTSPRATSCVAQQLAQRPQALELGGAVQAVAARPSGAARPARCARCSAASATTTRWSPRPRGSSARPSSRAPTLPRLVSRLEAAHLRIVGNPPPGSRAVVGADEGPVRADVRLDDVRGPRPSRWSPSARRSRSLPGRSVPRCRRSSARRRGRRASRRGSRGPWSGSPQLAGRELRMSGRTRGRRPARGGRPARRRRGRRRGSSPDRRHLWAALTWKYRSSARSEVVAEADAAPMRAARQATAGGPGSNDGGEGRGAHHRLLGWWVPLVRARRQPRSTARRGALPPGGDRAPRRVGGRVSADGVRPSHGPVGRSQAGRPDAPPGGRARAGPVPRDP